MKISQADWDSLWENSTGEQEKLFDAEGERFPDRRITLYSYFPIRLDCPWVSTSKTKKKSI